MALTSVMTFLPPQRPIEWLLQRPCAFEGHNGSLGIRKEQDTVNYNLAFPHLPWDVLEGSRHPQPAHLTMNPGLGSECPFQLGHLPSQCQETSPRRLSQASFKGPSWTIVVTL